MPGVLPRLTTGVLRRLAARTGRFPFMPITGGVGRGLKINLRNASADYVSGTNELPVQTAIRDHLRPGDVFYDIGSNVGFFALIAARLVGPAGQVYAFEPVPDNAECIRLNAARNGFDHLTVLPVAVGAGATTGRLLTTSHPGGATLSVADAADDVIGSIDVDVVSIDDLIDEGRLAPPTLVKIDVEGVELEVVEGMARTMGAAAPVVLCELDDATAEGVDRKLGLLRSALDAHGYGVAVLDSSYGDAQWNVVHTVCTPRA